MAEDAQIAVGEVVDVQRTSETLVAAEEIDERGRRRRVEPSERTISRMRLFLREPDGKERAYDIEDARLAVNPGQRAAIVYVRLRGHDDPATLMLVNFATDERDLFELAIEAHLRKRPLFGPIWKGVGLSLIMFAMFFLYSFFIVRGGEGAVMAAFLAGLFAALTFPVFWGGAALWEKIVGGLRYRRQRQDFLDALETRLRLHAEAGAP